METRETGTASGKRGVLVGRRHAIVEARQREGFSEEDSFEGGGVVVVRPDWLKAVGRGELTISANPWVCIRVLNVALCVLGTSGTNSSVRYSTISRSVSR